MPLMIVLLGIGLLLLLMLVFRLNGFISLIVVSIAVGLAEGMPALQIIQSIKSGVGSTLGNLALILGFGAMLGKLMADSGAAQRITMAMNHLGKGSTQWAVLISGFIVGIPLFYEVGFVLLIPLVFTIAAMTNIPLLLVGIPMAAALSVTHGFLPPHPGPTAIAGIYKADMGLTLVYGIVLAIPVAILAGPLFALTAKKIVRPVPNHLFNVKIFKDEEMPGFFTSILTGLIPVLLMAVSSFSNLYLPADSSARKWSLFIGDPVMALLVSVFVAIFTFGIMRGKKMAETMKSVAESVSSIAMILLIIGGGGAFKQILVDSGVGQYIAQTMEGSQLSPLVLAWSIAAILRLALGSATVAAMTAAGIVFPLIGSSQASPELMVIATGAGSLIFSHVNDPGFWLFKEYFGLTIGETVRTWSLLETIISVGGLIGVLALNPLL
ncbi:MAG: gluconate transporter [Deltaproteobacteria bacterium]|nr:gluconate transporter [Deltaproteobacteria bacterium]